MQNGIDLSDVFIILFVGAIFITGSVVVFKFMRGGKKK
jgi:NAD/NADP transhydrogenase beta subunit